MKMVLLTDLMCFPLEWNQLIPKGQLRGGELLLDDAIAEELKKRCDIPIAEWIVKKSAQPQPNQLAKAVARRTRLIAWIARRRNPGEIGVGDTLARLFGGTTGKHFAKWFAWLGGKKCGCADAQKWLNKQFPY